MPWFAVLAVSIPQSVTGQSGDLHFRRVVGLYEDIILWTIRKARLLVVSGTLEQSIFLVARDIDVVSFPLVEHDHAFSTLDALVGLALAKDWSLRWRKSAGGGLDVGDPAVEADHKFVGLAAVIGNPETGTDAPV
jgi:hypothetical protein